MNTTTYPAAETFAKNMPLPITVCKVTRELYNVTVPVLDVNSAAAQLASAGFRKGTEAHEAAMGILQARFDSYRYNRLNNF